MRLAAAQYRLRTLAGFDGFAAAMAHEVARAAEFGADLLVLPEYLGVQLLAPGDATPAALPPYAEAFRALFAGLAQRHRLPVLAGTTLAGDGAAVRNVAHLFHADGRVDLQAKLHLTPWERDWGLTAGDALVPVEIAGRRAAILVCYDIEFPELARRARAEGAELLLCPSCTDDRHGHWRVRHCAQARAIEDQVYVAVAALTGALAVDGFRQNVGQAAVLTPCDLGFPPAGVLAEGEFGQDTMVIADLDFAALARARTGGAVRTWQDRRPELY